jgi:hypothetical protein
VSLLPARLGLTTRSKCVFRVRPMQTGDLTWPMRIPAKCEGSKYLLDARDAAQTALRRSHV